MEENRPIRKRDRIKKGFSKLLKEDKLRVVAEYIENPGEFIESKNYFSWERYFTEQLIRKTRDSYLKYAKSKLNSVYLQDKVREKILDVMRGIELT